MNRRGPRRALLFVSLMLAARAATAQGVGAGPLGQGGSFSFDYENLNITMLDRETRQDLSPLQDLAISVSRLDFKASLKARREYYAGYRLLYAKNYQGAAEHLARATSTYPDFVAGHIALGSAYLGLRHDEQARDEFAKAITLDDHLPVSYLNLASADLSLHQYSEAEVAVRRASSLAPLDQQVLVALVYVQLLNHHFEAAVETARQVHSGDHERAAIVHYYAAAAWEAQRNLQEARLELQKLLEEDSRSPAVHQARRMLQNIDHELGNDPQEVPSVARGESNPVEPGPKPVDDNLQMQTPVERVREQRGGAAICGGCEETSAAVTGKARLLPDPDSRATPARWADSGWIFHSSVDEVAFMFAATDHGKAISDLTLADTTIRDGGKPPAAVTGFKGEAQLPLRLGLIIDTSESITTRFSFEQAVADDFMRRVVTGKEDLALVVGFSNSVLLVQDFTDDGHRISEAINKLAPAGGTALWDAVAFAADKLARRAEDQPVARMLVVITDGGDNSSRASLKRAIEAAEVGGVTIYAVSTQENRDLDTPSLKDSAAVSAHALRTLAEATGGKAFFPGSIHNMNRSLGDLQEVIRSRYFVSYKPALFKRDGRYRAIDITAHKFGHKLRTYVRKGYYAR